MKLQIKLLIIFLISSFISILSSFLIGVFLINFFDKSYNRFDIEKISLDIINEIGKLKEYDTGSVVQILEKWHKNYNDIDFAYMNERNMPVFSTNRNEFERREIKNIDEMKKRLEDEEKMFNQGNFRKFKFLDYFDNFNLTILKPVIIDKGLKGAVILSVKKDFSPPFTIRINKEKKIFITIILILSISFLILFSYILVFIFTMPIIKSIKLLFHKMNNFELDNKNTVAGNSVVQKYDAHNDEIGVLASTFDIMAEKINDDYKEKMRSLNERQELLKNVSHDFRTPLTSILGYAVSLDEGMYENEEEQARYYKIIRKKAEYMTELFDEMMELSRLDSNTHLLKMKEFDISELLREIIIEYIPQLEKDKYFIETDIPGSIIIKGDKDRLSRVIRNIIDNVIKHGYTGKYIGFEISGNDREIELTIKDKGRGLDEKNIDRIFERFFHGNVNVREGTSRIEAGGGMGLGLSIAKEIVEKHKGTITASNSKDGGAVFIITLPVK